jgi:alkyl hydroperoxide reductase subunit F
MTSPQRDPRERYDVVIVGAGPAGLSAAVYAARQGLATAVVAGSMGGQAMWARRVDNYIGWQLISGPQLMERFREHVSQFDVDCFEGNLVNAIVPADDGFDLYTREGLSLRASAVIIATGRAVNRLAIPGEDELLGRGVSYCATCDAAFFAGKEVVVVGPGESAADAALQLVCVGASKVTLVSQSPVVAPDAVLEKVAAEPRIETRFGGKPVRIEGNVQVTGLVLEVDGVEERIAAAGVFIESGAISASEFAMGLVELNDKGEIVVDKDQQASTLGVYAAGDVTDLFGKQIVLAAGQGARAAMAAGRDLKRR